MMMMITGYRMESQLRNRNTDLYDIDMTSGWGLTISGGQSSLSLCCVNVIDLLIFRLLSVFSAYDMHTIETEWPGEAVSACSCCGR